MIVDLVAEIVFWILRKPTEKFLQYTGEIFMGFFNIPNIKGNAKNRENRFVSYGCLAWFIIGAIMLTTLYFLTK